MAAIDLADHRIGIKIVYFGPTLGGKTTNVRLLHQLLPRETTGNLRSIDNDGRTLFYDYLPVDLPPVGGYDIHFQVYTVAGERQREGVRATVLSGADGVVFVADSAPDRLAENRASLDELGRLLEKHGKIMGNLPVVLQYNKRDLVDALSVGTMDQELNGAGFPRVVSTAISGEGVEETFREVARRAVRAL